MTEIDEPFFFEEEDHFLHLVDTVNENNTLLNLLEIMDQFCSEETQAAEPARASETYKHLLMFCVKLIGHFENKFHPSTENTLHMFTFTQFECLFVCLECLASLSGLINLSKEKSQYVDLRKECTRWCLSKCFHVILSSTHFTYDSKYSPLEFVMCEQGNQTRGKFCLYRNF